LQFEFYSEEHINTYKAQSPIRIFLIVYTLPFAIVNCSILSKLFVRLGIIAAPENLYMLKLLMGVNNEFRRI